MKPITRDGTLRGGRAMLIRALILAATGVSAYLLSVSLKGGSAAGCGPGSSCDEVLQSRWAYVFGIPVSVLALVVDTALLLTTLACGPKSLPRQRRGAWEILVPCSVLVLGAALWFMALQAFVLHRFCPWCLATHACGATAAILLLARIPIAHSVGRREKESTVQPTTVVKLAVAAVLAVALLGITQTIAPRKNYSISVVPGAASNSYILAPTTNIQANTASTSRTNTPSNLAANSTSAVPSSISTPPTNTSAVIIPAGVPALDLFAGRIRLDLSRAPVWGAPDAPFKLLSLYDYTCHHCREAHSHLLELQRVFGDKLAIVSLPMPLDAQCNPLVRQTPRPHLNACAYAKLGLIVWRARHGAIQPFDDWLFGFPNPPPLNAVTNKAVELVGMIPFQAASRDPWIEQQLRTDIDLYAISSKEFNQGNMPQFMIGTNIVSGPGAAEELRAVVAKYVDAGK